MRRSQRGLLWLGVSFLGLLGFSVISMAQTSPESQDAVPVTRDFSHKHVIFSRPATPAQVSRVQQDVRYWQQLYRRQSGTISPSEQIGSNLNTKRDWSKSMGSGASVGAGNYPAKYSFSLTTANCGTATQPDFTVYNTGLSGSATQASIVAYYNLYSGCTGTVPSVYWAYNTGGNVKTAVALSFDGKQVAFVQTLAGHARLVLLKWAASTTQSVSNPGTPTPVSLASYPTCTAPCMTGFVLTDSVGTVNDDTTSSIFYVYNDDSAYVGDSAGWLHQFTGVFKGTPTEVRTGGWPVHVNPSTSKALTVGVHDFSSGKTFVGDAGGFLYRVSPAAAVTASGQLDFGVGIVQGPIIDPTAAKVYVFASSDGSSACTGGVNCASVYALGFSFAAGNTGTKKTVGISTLTGTAPNPLYIGDFDSTYQNSVNSTGNLYVCGNTGGPPILYKVPIAAGVLGTATAGSVLSTSTTPCSPVTDVVNPNIAGGLTEWVFASADINGTGAGCAGGCIYNFKNTPWQASTAYAVGQEVVDSSFHIQVVTVAGTSGATAPAWSATGGTTTTDGTVTWFSQGVTSAGTRAVWVRLNHYPVGSKILDGNNNIEIVKVSNGNGNSGGNLPTWNTTVGGTTADAALTWTNLGPNSSSSLPSAGGTSGIIIDNTVSSGTLAGASQIYFSTLSNQTCATSGTTGGCAVQASQAALQ
ncbi:MAG: hypothetical protein JWQ87_2381 [Candidatus Sulfotelmatobacter sp.]|nr:hypothetical protein [Candidatus Sulfotelmatobacter sp.]